jgi:hypothetical protein
VYKRQSANLATTSLLQSGQRFKMFQVRHWLNLLSTKK